MSKNRQIICSRWLGQSLSDAPVDAAPGHRLGSAPATKCAPAVASVLSLLLLLLPSSLKTASAQSPRMARLPATTPATLRVTEPSGRVQTFRAALPRPRLALAPARAEEAQGAAPRGPGLPWLIPKQGAVRAAPQRATPENEDIPPPDNDLRIPLVQPADAGEVEVTGRGGLVSLMARDASLNAVLTMLAEHTGMNIVLTDATNSAISITLKDVRLEDALDAILSITGNTWTRKNNIIFVTNIANAGSLSTGVQGTVMRVFELDYASAADVAEAVTALLSPLGRSFINQMDKADNHKTKEIVVVEDLPHVVRQIESYIHQIDTPPRQVLIEACILKIDLKRTDVHGVNLNRLFSVLGHHIQLQTLGFAGATDTQALFGSFDGNSMSTLVECLQTTTDAKTLAKPRVLCLNGQEASFQVGKKLGYKIISTSQTSTLQSINFLNVGVILHVTPRISHDNQILMKVKPEVSDGAVDQTSGLPSSNTTDVQTDILLANGRGIVIGGLIQETDNADVAKIPVLGDIWLLGRLFQRRNTVRERAEVVIFIVPRIVPYDVDYQCITNGEIARTQTPLLGPQFARHPRPDEPQLYDAVENPRPLMPRSAAPASAPPNRPFMRRLSSTFSKPKVAEETSLAATTADRPAQGQVVRDLSPPVKPAPPKRVATPAPEPAPTKVAGGFSLFRPAPQALNGAGANDAAPPRVPKAGELSPGTIDFPPPPTKSNPRWVDSLKNGTLFR
jgi:type IV pilus assembly protein PilQ